MNYFLIGDSNVLEDLFGPTGAFSTILGGIINGLGQFATFFTTNTLGIIVLGVAIIGVVWAIIMRLFDKIHK